MKYGLHGKLVAQKGKGDQLSQILLEASELLSQAQGCLLYVVSKDWESAETVWISEVWETKEDHDNSLNVPGVRALIQTAMPILEGMPEKGQELHVIGGLGLS